MKGHLRSIRGTHLQGRSLITASCSKRMRTLITHPHGSQLLICIASVQIQCKTSMAMKPKIIHQNSHLRFWNQGLIKNNPLWAGTVDNSLPQKKESLSFQRLVKIMPTKMKILASSKVGL